MSDFNPTRQQYGTNGIALPHVDRTGVERTYYRTAKRFENDFGYVVTINDPAPLTFEVPDATKLSESLDAAYKWLAKPHKEGDKFDVEKAVEAMHEDDAQSSGSSSLSSSSGDHGLTAQSSSSSASSEQGESSTTKSMDGGEHHESDGGD